MIRRFATVMFLGVSLLTGCGGRDARTVPSWEQDFSLFLSEFQAASGCCDPNTPGKVDLSRLEANFAGRDVEWEGTLKYARRGRPFFREAFLSVDERTKLAVVMYYPPENSTVWEQYAPDTKVSFRGTIENIHVASGLSGKPFPYIELCNVTPIVE